MGVDRLRKDVVGLEERFAEIRDVELEESTLRLTVELLSGEYTVALLMPEEYPRGEPTNLEDFTMLRPGTVDKVCSAIISELRSRECGSPSPPPPEALLPYDELFPEQLQADITHFRSLHGDNIGVHPSGSIRSYLVRLALPLNFLGKLRLDSLFLTGSRRLVVELEWGWEYLDAPGVPGLRAFLSSSSSLDCETVEDRDESFGVVKWYIEDRLGTALRRNWLTRYEEYRKAAEAGSEQAGQEEEEEAGVPGGKTFNSNLRFSCRFENFFQGGNTNILHGIMRYLRYRMQVVGLKCVICDSKLGYECMKPAVCCRPTCEFALEQYGIGCSALAEIKRNDLLVELLLCFTYAALQASMDGSRDSFNPWCEHVEVGQTYLRSNGLEAFCEGWGGQGLHFRLPAGKNLILVRSVIAAMPPVSSLKFCASKKELRKVLDARHPLAYPLLEWVVASNRCHLMPIPKDLRFPEMGGSYQFVMCSSSPEKERRFRARREAAGGSFWAWHGSRSGNWHAILRLGLKNYSNTSMMTGGAVYGEGIYLARSVGTSLSYMGSPSPNWQASTHFSNGFCAIALCEVVDERGKEGCKMTDRGSIYIVQEEELVCTRFLFVFRGEYDGEQRVNADTLRKPEEILRLFDGN